MSKLPQVTTSIFSKMSLMAKEHSAINLSQGFPDFPIDKKLSLLIEKSVKKISINTVHLMDTLGYSIK